MASITLSTINDEHRQIQEGEVSRDQGLTLSNALLSSILDESSQTGIERVIGDDRDQTGTRVHGFTPTRRDALFLKR
jgi:hypothetical protein